MNWTVEYLPEAGGGEWAGGVVGRRPRGRGTAVLILRRKWLHCMGGAIGRLLDSRTGEVREGLLRSLRGRQ